MKDFLSRLPDELFLSEINIPGTHDSCTQYCTLSNMSRCQNLSIRQQLELGIRLFDIRLGTKSGEFFLVHALATCFSDNEKKNVLLFEEVLDDFREFLRENPRESLIISVKQDRGIMSHGFFPQFYDKYIRGNEDEWYLKNENPSLGDCRGKMVLMRRCKVWKRFARENPAGLDFSFWPDQAKKKTTIEVFPIAYCENGDREPSLTAHIQDRYSLEPEVKWQDCAKPFLDACPCDAANVSLHFISTSFRYTGRTLEQTAGEMNRYFDSYELSKERALGWFLFDFPTQELTDKIINSNFEIYKETIK